MKAVKSVTNAQSSHATSRSKTPLSVPHQRFSSITARQYRESFDVYSTKKSFEWSLVDGSACDPHGEEA
ncbi:MAG: hypothetical protein U0892_19215 [Pirellulales bacterium]